MNSTYAGIGSYFRIVQGLLLRTSLICTTCCILLPQPEQVFTSSYSCCQLHLCHDHCWGGRCCSERPATELPEGPCCCCCCCCIYLSWVDHLLVAPGHPGPYPI